MTERSLIERMTVGPHATLRAVIEIVSEPQLGFAMVIDENRRLVGVVTNGDTHRAIFSGVDLDASIMQVCNKSPVVLRRSELATASLAREAARRLIEKRGQLIPILGPDGCVEDLLRPSELEDRFAGRLDPVRGTATAGRSRRALVIGGAGYLGCVLARNLLGHGYAVRVLDNFSHKNLALYRLENQEHLEIRDGDIRDIRNVVSALEDIDAVVLLAAVVGDPTSRNNPKQTIEINYLAARMIAEATRYACIQRLLFASTCSVYGVGDRLLDESAPLNPVSHYAKTKIAAEQAILSMASTGFRPTVLRMSTLYGPSPRMRYDLVANVFSGQAARLKKITVHGGGQWRPMLHVEDAAEAFRLGLEAPIESVGGEVFNVGSEPQNIQIRALANLVREVFPSTQVRIEEGAADARDYRVSFAKIAERLGFRARGEIAAAVKEMGAMSVALETDEQMNSIQHSNSSLEY